MNRVSNATQRFHVIGLFTFLLCLVLSFGSLVGCTVNAAISDSENSNNSSQIQNTSNDNSSVSYTFRSETKLNEHYQKHGIDMGYDSAEEYLAGANAVVNNSNALHKNEAEDGDDVYYLESTDEIVFVSTDGYIRTYFNPGGIDYFNRQ
jgi:pyocin large subunit-like protein